MKKVTSKISFYWALQLISTALLYNLAQGGLCQARGIKESKSYLVKLEFMADTILPNDRINVSIDIGSASKLDRTKYSLEIIEVFVGKKGTPTQRQVLPLKSLLSEQELAGDTCIWIKAVSNARKIIASSPQTQAYTLICRIVDTQGQRVSNEIKKTVLTNNGRRQTKETIVVLTVLAGVYVALEILDKLYTRYFSTNPRSGPRDPRDPFSPGAGTGFGSGVGPRFDPGPRFGFGFDPFGTGFDPAPSSGPGFDFGSGSGSNPGFDFGSGSGFDPGFGPDPGFGSGPDPSFGFRPEVTTDFKRDRTLCCEILGIDSEEIATIATIDRAFRKKAYTEHPDNVGRTGTEEQKRQEKAKAKKRFQILGEAKEWLEKDLKELFSLYLRSSDASWIDTFYQQAKDFNVALSNGALTWGIIQTIINQEFGTGSDPSTGTGTGSGSGPELTTDFTRDRTLCCEILGIEEDHAGDLVAVERACRKKNLEERPDSAGKTGTEEQRKQEKATATKRWKAVVNAKKWLDKSLNTSSFKNKYERSSDASWIDTFYQQAEEFKVTLPNEELTWGVIQTIIDKSVEASLQQLQT